MLVQTPSVSDIISCLATSTLAEKASAERPIPRPTLTARSMNVTDVCRYFATSWSFGSRSAKHCETSEWYAPQIRFSCEKLLAMR
jgi:hypothetical protein